MCWGRNIAPLIASHNTNFNFRSGIVSSFEKSKPSDLLCHSLMRNDHLKNCSSCSIKCFLRPFTMYSSFSFFVNNRTDIGLPPIRSIMWLLYRCGIALHHIRSYAVQALSSSINLQGCENRNEWIVIIEISPKLDYSFTLKHMPAELKDRTHRTEFMIKSGIKSMRAGIYTRPRKWSETF